MVVLGGMLPSRQISAAGVLDRWWDDITGRKTQEGATASQDHAAPPPRHPRQCRAGGAGSGDCATDADNPGGAAKGADGQRHLEITGNAAAVNQVKLIARVVGFLEQIHFEDGALVRKGDLLFTIQQDQYKAQLQQAQAQLQLQQAALLYAKTEVVRYTALLKQDAATQVDVDHWNFEQASAEANILAAQAQIALAQLNLAYTEVRAPFDGQMGKHLIDVGNVVGGNGQEAALADITQLDPIYVVANISSQQALQIRANLDQRRLTLDAAASGADRGRAVGRDRLPAPRHDRIRRPGRSIRRPARCWCGASCAIPTGRCCPGMFVNIRMPMGKVVQSALLVPDRALQEDQGGRYLLVVDPGQRDPAALCPAWRADRRSARHHRAASSRTTAWWSASCGARRPARRWCRN